MINDLKLEAKQILEENWRRGFTIPTSRLYPFQWNWDSGFVSIGWSHFNLDFALQEIQYLFSGQWQNGMVPHIIFHSETEKTYFPNFDFWNSNVNPGAPQQPKTSGITQPAVIGFVLEEIYNRFRGDDKVVSFVKQYFPKVVKYHRFLYEYRDPKKEGLMFIFHPWESGRDNSPLWDGPMDSIVINKDELPDYKRRDTSIADASERPTSDQYDRYVYLLQLGKKHQYDGEAIAAESPFLVQDTLMNAVLIKSNNSLIQLGKELGFDVAEIEEWQSQSIVSYNSKMWNEALNFYTCYDLRNEKPILHKEIGAMTPLYAHIPTNAQAEVLNDYLVNLHNRGYFICPSFDVDDPLFDSKRYWRGPVWPQMNWMIHHGLKNYGFDTTADIVKNDLLTLIKQMGFYEYFESQKSIANALTKGYGGNSFSWTAACALDLMNA